ncbi:UNVERIFIED_CONTAM: Transcription initiation factor IIA subunit 2 [Trichonephila clavipes]
MSFDSRKSRILCQAHEAMDPACQVVTVPGQGGSIMSGAGHLETYRFCDNVWTFVLKDVEFREVQELIRVDKVKIVACDGKDVQLKL